MDTKRKRTPTILDDQVSSTHPASSRIKKATQQSGYHYTTTKYESPDIQGVSGTLMVEHFHDSRAQEPIQRRSLSS